MIRRYRSLLDGESKAAERCPRCERTDGSREKKPPPDENAACEDRQRGNSRIYQRRMRPSRDYADARCKRCGDPQCGKLHSRRRSRVTASM